MPFSKKNKERKDREVLQIARFGAIAICDWNRESQIASDLKGSALRFCCDLKKASTHKSHDLNCDLNRF